MGLEALSREDRGLAAAHLTQNAALLDRTDELAHARYGTEPTGEGDALRRVAAVLTEDPAPALLSFDITMSGGSRGTFQAATEPQAVSTAEKRFPSERVARCRQIT